LQIEILRDEVNMDDPFGMSKAHAVSYQNKVDGWLSWSLTIVLLQVVASKGWKGCSEAKNAATTTGEGQNESLFYLKGFKSFTRYEQRIR